jgi:hypothetical protein
MHPFCTYYVPENKVGVFQEKEGFGLLFAPKESDDSQD